MNPLNNFIGSSEASPRLVSPGPPPYGWGSVTGLTGHLAYKMKGEERQAVFHHVMMGSEPSDAIRVVNALLTQIDQIKRFPNVIILTTSNVTGAIDLAFVDR